MPAAGESPAPSFDLLAQRSEQARVRLVIGALLALIALTLPLRRASGGLVMSSPVFWWTLGLLGVGLAYEAWVLLVTTRANAGDWLIGETRWRLNAAIETAIAIGLLTISCTCCRPAERSPRSRAAPLSCRCSCSSRCSAFARRSPCGRPRRRRGARPGGGGRMRERPRSLEPRPVPLVRRAAGDHRRGGALVARRVRGYVEAAVREEPERNHTQVVARNTLIFALAKLAEYRDTEPARTWSA